ncbi:hypothetical protein [Ruminococcus sp. Marseille-P6503]|uniref:hypothetical protein n=1 Tax=Ruminococcus sp. Marseille-P6503 TaxID=2364796 RepID=UPI000F51C9E9|nr:hypothetical protein [Ruminococcus sp. Marseille-P6503]
MKGKQVKLYNIGFHPIFLFLFPQMWLISLPLNFIMDSAILLIGLKVFGKTEIKFNYKKVILKTWIFGYLSDLIATGLLFGFECMANLWRGDILVNPFGSVSSFLLVLVSVASAGFLIYLFNYKIALKKTNLDNAVKKKVSLLLALCTAPYLFFMPVVW